jgi:acyl-ACP thioesterase
MSDNIDFVPFHLGRRYYETFLPHLADCDPRGVVRFDALARVLQNVATNDWRDAHAHSNYTWVVRRTDIRVVAGQLWPHYLQETTVSTWASGHGAAWAERRTDIDIDDDTVVQARAIWVPINDHGLPVRLESQFFDVYPGARERKVPGRVPTPVIPVDATSRPWSLRRADLDVVGHVNNAALWECVTEMAPSDVTGAGIIHHGSIEDGDDVSLHMHGNELWLSVQGEIRVSAYVRTAPSVAQ